MFLISAFEALVNGQISVILQVYLEQVIYVSKVKKPIQCKKKVYIILNQKRYSEHEQNMGNSTLESAPLYKMEYNQEAGRDRKKISQSSAKFSRPLLLQLGFCHSNAPLANIASMVESKDEGARGGGSRRCNIVKRAFQKRAALACAPQTIYTSLYKKRSFDRDISSSPQWMLAGSAKLFNMSAAAPGESPKDAISPKLDQIT